MSRPFLRAGLIGGVILTIIALLGLRLGLVCLALPLALLAELAVGALAAYWLPPRRSIGRAAGQGALAGVITGLISGAVTVVLTSAFANPDITQAELSLWQPTPAALVQDVLVGAVVCTLGAVGFAAIRPK